MACRVVHLLLDHHADPNLLCNGYSPLALAIISGNDLVGNTITIETSKNIAIEINCTIT